MITLIRVLLKLQVNILGFNKVQVNVFVDGQFSLLYGVMAIKRNIYFPLKQLIGGVTWCKAKLNHFGVIYNNRIRYKKFVESRCRVRNRAEELYRNQKYIIGININL